MKKEKTTEIHNWIKNLNDDNKMRFALNWCRTPHTLLNVACGIKGGHKELQNVDWYKIHKSRDLGTWSHGGKVFVR
tara:strand:+ start:27 stop:254 length:228 start_codon:yes stop_codon:yes gene_type:complete